MLNESADQHAALMAARGLALRGGPIVLVILFLFVVTRWWALGILAGTALVITGGEIAIALHIAERGVVRSGLFVGAALLLVVMIAAAIMMEFLVPSANTSLMGWRGGAFVVMLFAGGIWMLCRTVQENRAILAARRLMAARTSGSPQDPDSP